MRSDDIISRIAAQNPWWNDPSARPREGHMVRRSAFAGILAHVREAEHRAVVLAGPRRVGKTTLLLQVASELLHGGYPPGAIVYCKLDEPGLHRATLDDIQRALPRTSAPAIFLLDEVSQSPDWDSWLKQLVDRRVGKWLATDSSATVLRDGTRESGMGRWDLHRIEGLSFREFLTLQPGGEDDSPQRVLERFPNVLDRYLTLGGLPEHAQSDDFGMVRRRIRDDVLDRALAIDLLQRVGDVKGFRALFAYLVEDSGAVLNSANRARDLGIDRRTVQEWLDVATQAALLVQLPRESATATGRLRANDKPKVYAADHVFIGALAIGDPADVRSRIVECAVFTHLRELARAGDGRLSYFRPRDDLEIDFVLTISGRRVGVEVTSSPKVPPKKLRRTTQAARSAKVDSSCVVYSGVARHPVGETRVIPLRNFLLDPSLVLEETDG
jgi:predicted AAA+ superfamily ATPase